MFQTNRLPPPYMPSPAMNPSLSLLLTSLALASAQLVGDVIPETHLSLQWTQCSAAGDCRITNGALTADENGTCCPCLHLPFFLHSGDMSSRFLNFREGTKEVHQYNVTSANIYIF